ncbi:MAG: ribosome maturation factor RimP [Candidatus Latescibacterota bacterium]|nr:MAG: ribosome maturation factor RimP [Candidatus Latescibacterota bacterium]
MSSSTLPPELRARIEEHVESLGFECVDMLFALEGGRRILRIVLDSSGGVVLDECARVSRELGPILDECTDLPAGYYLEVSSPGINRPLTKPAHFERFKGERVKVRLREASEWGRTITGVLGELVDDEITIETPSGPRTVALSQIARARLQRDLDALLKSKRRS